MDGIARNPSHHMRRHHPTSAKGFSDRRSQASNEYERQQKSRQRPPTRTCQANQNGLNKASHTERRRALPSLCAYYIV